MKFVSVRDFRNNSGQIWERLREEQQIVLTLNGQPNALLIPLTGETFESTVAAVRQATAMEAVQRLQVAASPMTMGEIDAEIKLAREERAKV